MISYRNNHKKTLEGLVWFAQHAPDLDHYWAVKTLFFADYFHLNKYGRPVFGDKISALEWGPVPSFALSLINKATPFVTPDEVVAACEAFNVVPSKTGQRLVAKRPPRLEFFSRSDIICLNEALEFCRPKTFDELVRCTHDMPAYRQAWDSRCEKGSMDMDFALLFDESQYRDEMIRYAQENALAVF